MAKVIIGCIIIILESLNLVRVLRFSALCNFRPSSILHHTFSFSVQHGQGFSSRFFSRSLFVPAREPRPDLILPVFIHPPRARIRQQRTVVRFVILPECRHAFARPPAADSVVAVLEWTWASGYWRHPEVHLAVFVGAQRDVEARWFPVAVWEC